MGTGLVGIAAACRRPTSFAGQRRCRFNGQRGGPLMAEASIPVDLFNPGQVFACLGFVESADVLLGDAEGGFDWSDPTQVRFHVNAAGAENPFAVVLKFLAEAQVYRCGPARYTDPTPKKKKATEDDADEDEPAMSGDLRLSDSYPNREGDR